MRIRMFLLAAAMIAAPARQALAQTQAVPPGFTLDRTGAQTDFDYFEGAWQTAQHRMVRTGERKGAWEDFPGTLCMRRYLGGLVTVDELYFPRSGQAGLTLRTFDPAKRQWSIYWVSSQTGRLDPVPVVGGFAAGRGEFYAEDRLDGRPIKVRYLWQIRDRDHARWEQAFSDDDRNWETNWTAEFTRADPQVTCPDGRPRR
jgi:hypothetical protein